MTIAANDNSTIYECLYQGRVFTKGTFDTIKAECANIPCGQMELRVAR